jgi:protein O-GlcNAc transferase
MTTLINELKIKINKFYQEKNYSELEKLIESLKNFDQLPISILMTYAVSKALNPKSKTNDYKKAAFYFEKIYKIDEDNLEPLYNLIIVSLKAKKFTDLNNLLENVYLKNKNDPKIIEGLAKTNFFLGNMSKATFFNEELIKVRTNFFEGWTKYLGSINYHQDLDQKNYLYLCKKFDNSFVTEELKLKLRNLNSDEKFNIGFVSPDFKNHSVSFFLRDILKKIDKNKFNVIAYSNVPVTEQDTMSLELKKIFNEWEDIYPLNDGQARKIIIDKQTDILVDLAGFTLGNRINLFKTRSAPIQISWLGYCNTLGIKNMDYIIADKNLIKQNEKNLYSEKVLYMPNIWNALSQPKEIPKINFEIFDKVTKFSFGSLNNFLKISDKTIKVWSKILRLTDSNLVLKSSSNDSSDIKKNLLNKFSKENVNLENIILLDRFENQKDHLNCYNKFHLTLDTFPYPGVTTSFESLIMGKPVLTMKGNNFNSRCGESINLNLNLNEFIAENEEDYINKAIIYANEPQKLKILSTNLREQVLSSPLFDTQTFANELNSIFLNIIK